MDMPPAAIHAACAGDPTALNNLIKQLYPRLSRMAGYYARCSGQERDDLLQEAWQGLLEALPRLDLGIGSPQQYLIQCARWRLLSFIRTARLRRCVPLSDGLPCRDLKLEEAAVGMDLVEFCGLLRDSQRQVLRCLLEGHTWRETGRRLGCTSANVAYHVRQIRQRYIQRSGGKWL